MFNDIIFENHAVYEIMWKNTIQLNRSQMKIWLMRKACWIPKASNTHSDYVTLIGFPGKNGCLKVPQGYVIHTMPVLLYFILQKPRIRHHIWLSITLRKVHPSAGDLQCHQRKEGIEQLITLRNTYGHT